MLREGPILFQIQPSSFQFLNLTSEEVEEVEVQSCKGSKMKKKEKTKCKSQSFLMGHKYLSSDSHKGDLLYLFTLAS